MVVLAYYPSTLFPGAIDGYSHFVGQVELEFNDSAEIDIGALVYAELETLPPAEPDSWGYAYIWKAQIFQEEPTTKDLTSFASIPIRYKIGHVSTNSNAGTIWNDVLTFEDQVTPLFRGNFYTGNPNPGDGFPFGTLPLGDSVISVWRAFGNASNIISATIGRGSYFNVFLFKPATYIVRITYTAYLSFNAYDILAVAPKPFVVVYP